MINQVQRACVALSVVKLSPKWLEFTLPESAILSRGYNYRVTPGQTCYWLTSGETTNSGRKSNKGLKFLEIRLSLYTTGKIVWASNKYMVHRVFEKQVRAILGSEGKVYQCVQL